MAGGTLRRRRRERQRRFLHQFERYARVDNPGADDGSVTPEVSSVYSHANELDESARVELIPGGHVDTLYTDEGVNADTIALVAEFFRKNAG